MPFDTRLLTGLGVLSAIVERGTFAGAGELLGLTPSGVSRAVARLEERVGVRLFDRTPRAVSLTQEGRRFHDQVLPILASLEEATAEASGAATQVRGHLRVNVDPWFARLVLTERIPHFLAAFPALSLELVMRDTVDNLVAEGLDVAVRFGEPPPSTLIAKRLLESRVITCASPAYLKRHGTPKHPRDLLNHECLLFRDPNTGRPFGWEFRRAKRTIVVKVKGRLMLNDGAAALSVCAAGHGIAQPVALGLGQMLVKRQLVQILPEWAEESFPLYAYHPSRHLPPAKVRAFIDFVVGSVPVAARLGP